ncbi:hypothetical protein FACUT_6379 [Fusarium acutatum]|uniref:Uncharacterized protein n=1 Tax=Fusarium acutatum TaxID=78861 RepID=A0A8H4JR43_9HYPO|nr:hypothetical protein FACUT_6379 [Fusarium acutatum]
MAGFRDLPAELTVAIMKSVYSPQDISAMVHADPWLLHCFLNNRKQLMTPFTAKIIEVSGGHVSTAYLLAARLRHAKQNPGFNDPSPPHREFIVKWILWSCINSHNTHHHVSHRASLATICALSTLAIDVGWLITSYISQARPLFPRDLDIRCLLFEPGICGAEDENDATRPFYSIAYYIYDQHCTMMKNLMSSLGVNEKCLVGGKTQDRRKSRLQNCKQIEVNKYVHYLTTQGLGMLLQLQSMELQDQLQFVLWTFESILDSPYTNILMVHGIELYSIGTLEKHSWNPWVHCEDVFEMHSDEWKTADSFWDSGWRSRWGIQ